MKNQVALLLAFFSASHLVSGQTTFRNLDFEQARIVPIGSEGLPLVVASSAIPGWTAYQADTPLTEILYNTVTIGTPMLSIHDSASTIFQPLEGSYSVAIQHATAGSSITAAIGQTGLLPPNALSLRFYAASYDRLQVTFAGNTIPFFVLGTGPGYSILGGDIATYAGQTGELRFTHLTPPFLEWVELDNIQFSTQPVPEPSIVSLLAFAGLFGYFFWRARVR